MDSKKLIEIEAILSPIAAILVNYVVNNLQHAQWDEIQFTFRGGGLSKLRLSNKQNSRLPIDEPIEVNRYLDLTFDLKKLHSKHEKELSPPWTYLILSVFPDGSHKTDIHYNVEDPTFFDFKKE